MDKVDAVATRHSIDTAGEMIVLSILFAATMIAESWWSFISLIALIFWCQATWDEQAKRKRWLQVMRKRCGRLEKRAKARANTVAGSDI